MSIIVEMSKQELQVELIKIRAELETSEKVQYSLRSQLTSYQDNHTRREDEIEAANKKDTEYMKQLEKLIIKNAINGDK